MSEPLCPFCRHELEPVNQTPIAQVWKCGPCRVLVTRAVEITARRILRDLVHAAEIKLGVKR